MKKVLSIVWIATVLTPQTLAWAADAPAAPTYDCQVIISAPELPDTVQLLKFQASAVATGSHGGDPYVFNFGAHEVLILANARWKGISWSKDKKPIASVITVMDRDSAGSQV